MRKLLDRIAHRLGYVRWDRTIQGDIEMRLGNPTYVDLKLPGGSRVCGWVDSPLRNVYSQPNPLL